MEVLGPGLKSGEEVVSSVSVNAQTDVFTSEKSVKNVQNFRAGREYNSSFELHTSIYS